MRLVRALVLGRWVFVTLLVLSALFGLRIYENLEIDTNLADISPSILSTPQTRFAGERLNKSIEQRLLLLLVAANEDDLIDADEQLRRELEKIPGVAVLASAEELFDRFANALKPYRFSLLSEEQRATLLSSSSAAIAQQAQDSLFGLSGTPRIYSFSEDPLAWHSNTLAALINQPSTGLSDTTIESADQVSVLTLKLTNDSLNMKAQDALLSALERVVARAKIDHRIEIERSGVFFFAAHAASESKQDISLISIGSGVGVVVLLLFAFGSFRALGLPLISIGLGVIFAFVVTHTLYGKVHILTIVFGASLIGIVIDYSLHYFYHGANQQPHSYSERKALYRALLLSLTTSLIGYAALSFSDLDALKKVAVFSCCGLLMAWLSVVCLGDLALRKPIKTDARYLPWCVSAFSSLLARVSSRVWAVASLLLVSIATLIVFHGSPFDDDPRLFFNAPQSLLASERKVAAVASDYEPGRYLIIYGDSEHQVYARHAQLFERIERVKGLTASDFTSVLSWVPSQQQQEADYAAQERLYGDAGAAQLFIAGLASQTPVSDIQQAYRAAANTRLSPDDVISFMGDALPPLWLRADPTVVNFVLIKKGVNADLLALKTDSIEGVEYVNTLARTQAALTSQRASATNLLLLAYLLVALLLILRYREIAALWLISVPLTSSAMLVVLSAVFAFSLNLFHVMALFLVLGFGMDYTIFAREVTQRQSITLQAILLSALTSLLSFGLLGLSSIPVVSSFGVTLLIGNIFNLLGVLVYARTQTRT